MNHSFLLVNSNLTLNGDLVGLKTCCFKTFQHIYHRHQLGLENAIELSSIFPFSSSSSLFHLQHHHFAQTVCILNNEGCNIFCNLTNQVFKILEIIDFFVVQWLFFLKQPVHEEWRSSKKRILQTGLSTSQAMLNQSFLQALGLHVPHVIQDRCQPLCMC